MRLLMVVVALVTIELRDKLRRVCLSLSSRPMGMPEKAIKEVRNDSGPTQ